MEWNKHLRDVPEGAHAFLGASKYSWLNYDEQKLAQVYKNHQAVELGTQLHAYACQAIKLKQKQPKSRKTICMYINDAIGFQMEPEQPLYYSENCFGTADAICFRKNLLRIHDLKTGTTPASLKQLYIYSALFCLEYKVKPADIEMELRIYQNDEIIYGNPTPEDIVPIMDKIVTFDQIIKQIKEGD